jgi:SAM-dependent methyltransferase
VNALYDAIGKGYADFRKPDPRIAAAINLALGDARRIVNIGAGAGSYEPAGRDVIAVEPSAIMIAQRPTGAAPVICGTAEALPFADKSFDVATAFLTTHHWSNLGAGLREMARVARGRCVFLDHTPGTPEFWLLRDYFPIRARSMKPLLDLDIARTVFAALRIVPIAVPHDCSDGFLGAYWRRPRAYLDARVRDAISFFAHAPQVEVALDQLRRDLDDGTWLRRNGQLLRETELDLGYRLIVATLKQD